MIPLRRLISSVLMFSLLPSVFHGPLRQVASADEITDEQTGLQFRLSQAGEEPEVRPAANLATASELSQSEIESVVRRLPPMTIDPSDVQEFALRESSLRPPRTGNTIETSFPAPAVAASEPTTSGPLEVVRYSPEGGVPLAPELSVTFSQPMVALTSQDEAATNVPVKLTPQPPGKWRWLGTKTLIFDPQVRFPMATTYVVTVPAGTRAANGSTLATEKSWSFTTPPLTVKASYPLNDSQPRDALMFIEFDQRIDPVAVLRTIKVNVPMRYLADGESVQDLVISKGGEGRLYYRLAMSYAPVNLNVSSADYGFAVERAYEAIDHAEDVQRGADGAWRIKAGARVRVRVTMAAPSRRYHVALVDYLPAGFETLNPELATTEAIPEDKKQKANLTYVGGTHGFNWWLWRPVWFDHQNLRNERSEAFTTLLWGGVYNYSYVARATTPGVFIVPPAKAEEMYHPETFGRSKSDRVRID